MGFEIIFYFFFFNIINEDLKITGFQKTTLCFMFFINLLLLFTI